MNRNTCIDRIASHRNELAQYNVKRLAIFGSAARDELQPDSDVDVLVEFDGPARFDPFMDLKFFLEDLLERSVDLVTVNAVRSELRDDIQRESINVA